MTKKEFNLSNWNKFSLVKDTEGHCGRVISINFDYGVIHYEDSKSQCAFGKHYKFLTLIS